MKIEIYSREAMEEALARGLPKKTAVISFHDPIGRGKHRCGDYAPIDYDGKCERFMQIAIRDLDPEALLRFGLTVERYFPEADALAAFIYEAIHDGFEIICQCDYGQSRSAACAAAILQHFEGCGIDIFADYRYYPNQLVYHKVLDALERHLQT